VISISPESQKKSSIASPEKKKSRKAEFQISNDNSPSRVPTDQQNPKISPALKKRKITNDGSILEKPCIPGVPIKGKLEDYEIAFDATNANNSSLLGKRQKFSTNASDEKIEFEEDWDLLSHLLEQNDPTKNPKDTPFPDPTKAHLPKGFEKKFSIPKAPPSPNQNPTPKNPPSPPSPHSPSKPQPLSPNPKLASTHKPVSSLQDQTSQTHSAQKFTKNFGIYSTSI
jgi:hypothetical protein